MTGLDAFLEALIVQSCRAPNPNRPMTPNDLVDFIRQAQRRVKPSDPATPGRWSDWLRHRQGDPCPVPPSAKVETRKGDEQVWPGQAGYVPWHCVTSFRYLADNPAGWLPRGDWIPPAGLWRDDCPVRCEWRFAGGDDIVMSGWPSDWNSSPATTHIRLVARERAEATQPEPAAVPELPEWARGPDRKLYELALQSGNVVYLSAEDIAQIGELRDILAARRRVGL